MYQSLQDFKNFLIERKLAPENQITFYANWVSKFIRFSNVISDKPIHLKMQIFIDDLKKYRANLSGMVSAVSWLPDECQKKRLGIRRRTTCFRRLYNEQYIGINTSTPALRATPASEGTLFSAPPYSAG